MLMTFYLVILALTIYKVVTLYGTTYHLSVAMRGHTNLVETLYLDGKTYWLNSDTVSNSYDGNNNCRDSLLYLPVRYGSKLPTVYRIYNGFLKKTGISIINIAFLARSVCLNEL